MPKKPKIGLVSLGCPKNLVDSEFILGTFAEHGYEVVEADDADVVIVNTCAFIHPAEEESVETINEFIELKKSGRLRAVGIAGCMVERRREEILRMFPEVDFVIGTDELDRAVELFENAVREIPTRVPHRNFSVLEYPRFVTTYPYAYIKVAEGCDRKCSFCTIPSIRGRHRARPMDDILTEAHSLAEMGAMELVIISQDLTLYPRLPELIERLSEVDVEWIRLLYLHPAGVNKALMEAIARNPKIVPYVELPIQHISDRILKLMARDGGRAAVERAIDLVRQYMPDAFIRTELIIGFPTETDQEFQELMDYIEQVGFERIGIFKFWPEPGTPSAEITPRIPDEEIEKRMEIAEHTAYHLMERAQKRLLNRDVDVLIEEVHGRTAYGRTMFDAPEVDLSIVLQGDFQPGDLVTAHPVKLDEHLDLIDSSYNEEESMKEFIIEL